ncbi:MAG: hypothetical protein KBA51_02920 [Kiritimatiellae bacterium]|nr:hypothetical protein [Kiritimatiellia bacterium]
MARSQKELSELDRKIADLDGQLEEIQRAIRSAERQRAQPASPPVRTPWTTPDHPPSLSPGAMPPAVARSSPSPAAVQPAVPPMERARPEEVKRRFANYLSSGPMMADMTRPLRGQRRKQMARVWLLAATVLLMAWVVFRLSGCGG